MQLRPYQEKGVSDIINAMTTHSRVCYQLPTGGGKTIVLSELIRCHHTSSVVVIAHRQEILKQIHSKLGLFGMDAGIIAPWAKPEPDKAVQVASVQTLARKGQLPPCELLVIDECHHASSNSYLSLIDKLKPRYVIGFTATPCRLSGKPLGDIFNVLVEGESVKSLMSMGMLCGYEVYGPKENINKGAKLVRGDYDIHDAERRVDGSATIYGDPVQTWQALACGKKTIGFACTVESANKMMGRFRIAGISSDVIHGSLSQEQRDGILEFFRNGNITVLWSVDVIGEGFDLPECEAAILARPTASLTIYLQQVGRVLRPAANKAKAIILDHACNVMNHGMPDMERKWSLTEGAPKPSKKAVEQLVRACPKCSYINLPTVLNCEKCGHVFYKPRKVTERQASFGMLTQEDLDNKPETTISPLAPDWVKKYKNKTYRDLLYIAKIRGFKAGWAYMMAKKLIAYGVPIKLPISYEETKRLMREVGLHR